MKKPQLLKFSLLLLIIVVITLSVSIYQQDEMQGYTKITSYFSLDGSEKNIKQVTEDESPIYLHTSLPIIKIGTKTESYNVATDTIYIYEIGSRGATLKITVRTFKNGNDMIFASLNNPSRFNISVDLFQKETDITAFELIRFDQFPIKRNKEDKENYHLSTYPTGVLRFIETNGLIRERMIGQAYQSQQLVIKYKSGGKSVMRELISENEALSYYQMGTDMYVFYSLVSEGKDRVDTWFMDSDKQLFKSEENMGNWMKESATYYKKRNKWYTPEGPYNKMVTTTEPMPESFQGYGRNLLLMKEDRALELFVEQGDRYFENLIKNSFISLYKFKGKKDYWETEVTSTYLKDLYGITAPFIDTRFNEQIALFYYNSGGGFGLPDYFEPLRNYADLLVSQEEKGNIILVDEDSYYISDYFPTVKRQNVTTHSSMNHVLGGMNLLLIAYREFGDEKYLKTARAIQTAIATQKNLWIRDNGDLWYKVDKEGNFVGNDYKHLTLEDLIQSYRLWMKVDPTYLPVLEELIKSKVSYLSENELGYTKKIKDGLEQLGMMKYLPKGPMHTGAL